LWEKKVKMAPDSNGKGEQDGKAAAGMRMEGWCLRRHRLDPVKNRTDEVKEKSWEKPKVNTRGGCIREAFNGLGLESQGES